MRMIPPSPAETSTGSERKVFSLLAQSSFGPDAYALTSLNLAEHEYQRWGEIDFFLVLPCGLIALEVKGGEVDCIDGVWRFEDRRGRVIKKNVSPIAQAQAGYSSVFNKYLKPSLPAIAPRITGGFCAVFPAATRESIQHLLGGTEMPPALIGTKEDCANPAAFMKFISSVSQYWVDHKRGSAPILGKEELRAIVQSLRPSVDRVQPLSLCLQRVRDEQLSLTADQYRLLDYLAASPRLVCTGGAGTGKTFIALECLRREIGNNPVFVTGTPLLAAHLRASNVVDPERIFSFEELAARRHGLRGAFSSLIVDEGQQITSRGALEIFADVLGTPFSTAHWRWFSDPNLQVSGSSDFDPDVHASLLQWAEAAPYLPENCRNTPQIIEAVEFLTGARLGSTKVRGIGPKVEYAKESHPQGIIDEIARRIQRWVGEDAIPAGEIVLLSMRPVGISSIPAIARAAGLDFAEWKPGWTEQAAYPAKLGASSIEQFRGIEAPVAVLCDLHGSFADVERALYLGMTRANFGMFVALDQTTSGQFIARRLSQAAGTIPNLTRSAT
ncbi:MAG: hypothetical protein JWR07_1431 [Nevskia sp.]|nr:hypothetical protein [Nevskia sp.]